MNNKLNKKLTSILKKVSRALFLSINILPNYIKTMLGSGYLICRAMDSIVDSNNIKNNKKEEILNCFEDIFKDPKKLEIKLKEVNLNLEKESEKELILNFPELMTIVSNFKEEDKKYLNFLIKGISNGMKIDLKFFDGVRLNSFKTEKDLIKYARLIGGIPGLFWIEVYNSYLKDELKDSFFKLYAYKIGTALQLTNIIKDISEDLKNNRCYFPENEILNIGLKKEDLLEKENFQKFKIVLNKWIIYTINLLDCSEKFISNLNKSKFTLRSAIIWQIYWAMDTLEQTILINPLEKKGKIKRNKIYSTIIKTPSMLLSNTVFQRGYRFRRETILAALNDGV